MSHRVRRGELLSGQEPFAVILGCSDSRVPAELIFDQGLGDLFVIRVAGNVVAPSQVGSVEFAAQMFGTQLVVVMGHTQCGAVEVTVNQLTQPESLRSPNTRAIVNRIKPAIEPLMAQSPPLTRSELLTQAVRANVRASVDHLMNGSDILKGLITEGALRVVGAEYSLETGRVEFFDPE